MHLGPSSFTNLGFFQEQRVFDRQAAKNEDQRPLGTCYILKQVSDLEKSFQTNR